MPWLKLGAQPTSADLAGNLIKPNWQRRTSYMYRKRVVDPLNEATHSARSTSPLANQAHRQESVKPSGSITGASNSTGRIATNMLLTVIAVREPQAAPAVIRVSSVSAKPPTLVRSCQNHRKFGGYGELGRWRERLRRSDWGEKQRGKRRRTSTRRKLRQARTFLPHRSYSRLIIS